MQNLQEPEVYVIQHNGTKKGTWQYRLHCTEIPLTTILFGTIGAFLAIMLILFVAAVAIININDYRKYQQYLTNKREAEEALSDMSNPLFEDPNKRTENPMFQR